MRAATALLLALAGSAHGDASVGVASGAAHEIFIPTSAADAAPTLDRVTNALAGAYAIFTWGTNHPSVSTTPPGVTLGVCGEKELEPVVAMLRAVDDRVITRRVAAPLSCPKLLKYPRLRYYDKEIPWQWPRVATVPAAGGRLVVLVFRHDQSGPGPFDGEVDCLYNHQVNAVFALLFDRKRDLVGKLTIDPESEVTGPVDVRTSDGTIVVDEEMDELCELIDHQPLQHYTNYRRTITITTNDGRLVRRIRKEPLHAGPCGDPQSRYCR